MTSKAESKKTRSRANRYRPVGESKIPRLVESVIDLAYEYNEGFPRSGFVVIDAEPRYDRCAAYVINSSRVEIRLESAEPTLWEIKPTATERGKLAPINIYGFVRARWRYQPWALNPRAKKGGAQ